ncbi:hypothetical protein A4S05_10665 [Nostoc sp. KVJ20]|uniref:hypothetical protein n=1 Tax=Nostoc sp. KVJ20 TaxID=457944 RepID=UPI00083DD01D|nr:hypothetical protein [Nostoc sp. KVJ20]ODG98159.1 hypothetical protein A4S05_10665 [Nostoc sp. KVJ20]
MIYSLIVFFLLLLTIPFVIAQIMPNKKWLIAYTIFFGTLAIALYYNHLTTPTYRQGNGFSYAFGIAGACLFDTSIIVGIINRAIVLYFRSIGYTIKIWFIISLFFLDLMLIALIFPALLTVY